MSALAFFAPAVLCHVFAFAAAMVCSVRRPVVPWIAYAIWSVLTALGLMLARQAGARA